ncbi:MAG TPA: filamentous hemagglutinin N-terminal domain-containing protein [Leptolyngbyaceae cyanobacterium]
MPTPSNAQVIPDATLQNNTTINVNGTTINIEGGTRLGNNLFHSLRELSLPTGNNLHFNNSLDIQNIITRITGGTVSNIDGLISANGSANLFLINPSGISFGPNARIGIGGSLFVTTADSLEFADGSSFSAVNPQEPLLTVDIPIRGLRFSGNSGSITVQGVGHTIENSDFFAPINPNKLANSLEVKSDNTLALISSDIVLDGAILRTTNGKLELLSVGKGEVLLDNQNNQWLITPANNSIFQDIKISNNSLLYEGSFSGAANYIKLQGNNISLEKGSLIFGQTFGEQRENIIFINAVESLNVQNESPTNSTGIFNVNFSNNPGGNVEINSQKIFSRGSQIATSTFSNSASGNVILNAKELNIDGLTLEDFSQSAGINTFSYSSGKGGDIIANIAQVIANNGIIAAYTFGSGDSGNLRLNSNFISLRSGSSIASATFNQGNSGSVLINSNSIEVIGTSTALGTASNISSSTYNNGNAGSLEINSSNLLLQDGGNITTSTFAVGNAGNLSIRASESVTISGKYLDTSSVISSSAPILNERIRTQLRLPPEPTGTAGSLTIDTPKLTISNFGQVSVTNEGSGNAGTININSKQINISDQGAITATTAVGEGGDINLQSQTIQLNNGIISSTAGTNRTNGNGGNIGIETGVLILQNNSEITANAFAGRGGNIQINSPGVFASPDSRIVASSEQGVNGSVKVTSTQIDVATVIRNEGFQSPPPFHSCSPEPFSLPDELTIFPKGGFPRSPDDYLTPIWGWTDPSAPIPTKTLAQTQTQTQTQTQNTENIVVAQAWRNNGDGTVNFTITPDSAGDITAYSSPIKSPCIKRATDTRSTEDGK